MDGREECTDNFTSQLQNTSRMVQELYQRINCLWEQSQFNKLCYFILKFFSSYQAAAVHQNPFALSSQHKLCPLASPFSNMNQLSKPSESVLLKDLNICNSLRLQHNRIIREAIVCSYQFNKESKRKKLARSNTTSPNFNENGSMHYDSYKPNPLHNNNKKNPKATLHEFLLQKNFCGGCSISFLDMLYNGFVCMKALVLLVEGLLKERILTMLSKE